MDQIPTYVQQLQFSVKNPTVGKAATFTKVDAVIQETKNAMNCVSKVVATCFECANKVANLIIHSFFLSLEFLKNALLNFSLEYIHYYTHLPISKREFISFIFFYNFVSTKKEVGIFIYIVYNLLNSTTRQYCLYMSDSLMMSETMSSSSAGDVMTPESHHQQQSMFKPMNDVQSRLGKVFHFQKQKHR